MYHKLLANIQACKARENQLDIIKTKKLKIVNGLKFQRS